MGCLRVISRNQPNRASAILHRLLSREENTAIRKQVTATIDDDPNFDTAIVDSEGQSPFAYEAYAFGRYDRRADVQSAYATYLPSNSIFRGVDRLKLIKSIMEADGKNRGAQIKLGELLAKDALRAAYPLHDAGEVAALTDKWLTYAAPPWRMPVDAIKDYYGEKIGTYFHFLGHYTTWLAIAAGRAELDRRFGGVPPELPNSRSRSHRRRFG